MEIYNLPHKKFKIAVLRKLNELQENTETQFNGIRKRMHEHNEKINKEIEIIKKELNRNLKLKDSTHDVKTAIESINIRIDQKEERISELEDRNVEIIPSEEKKKSE